MKDCKQCGKNHDPQEIKRTLGEYSNPYLLGYCSAYCYTKSLQVKTKQVEGEHTKGNVDSLMEVLRHEIEFLEGLLNDALHMQEAHKNTIKFRVIELNKEIKKATL